MRRSPREKRSKTTLEIIEAAAKKASKARYKLRLYITGTTPQSQRALSNIKRICDKHLEGRYDLEVIDVYQKPTRARDEEIIVAPTLIKMLPLPIRKLIGDLSDETKVLFGLDLYPKRKPPRQKEE